MIYDRNEMNGIAARKTIFVKFNKKINLRLNQSFYFNQIINNQY